MPAATAAKGIVVFGAGKVAKPGNSFQGRPDVLPPVSVILLSPSPLLASAAEHTAVVSHSADCAKGGGGIWELGHSRLQREEVL